MILLSAAFVPITCEKCRQIAHRQTDARPALSSVRGFTPIILKLLGHTQKWLDASSDQEAKD